MSVPSHLHLLPPFEHDSSPLIPASTSTTVKCAASHWPCVCAWLISAQGVAVHMRFSKGGAVPKAFMLKTPVPEPPHPTCVVHALSHAVGVAYDFKSSISVPIPHYRCPTRRWCNACTQPCSSSRPQASSTVPAQPC